MKSFAVKIFLAFLGYLFFYPIAYGIPIENLKPGSSISSFIEMFSSSEKKDIDFVIKNSQAFAKKGDGIPRFGYTNIDTWAKLELENAGKPIVRYFEFRAPIEMIYAYSVADEKVVVRETSGMNIPINRIPLEIRGSYPVVKMEIPAGKSTIYFNEKAVAPHYPITIHDKESLENSIASKNNLLFMYLGVSIAFILLLIISFVFVNRLSSVFLIVSFTAFFLVNGFVTGLFRILSTQEMYVDLYMLVYQNWAPLIGVYSISISAFAISVSHPKTFFSSKPIIAVTLISLISQALLIVVSLFDVVTAFNLFAIGFNIIECQIIYFSYKRFKAGEKEELLPVVGWGIFALFSTLQLTYYLGWLDFEFFSVTGTIIGMFALITLLLMNMVEQNRQNLKRTLQEKNQVFDDLQRNFVELRKRDEIIQIFSNPLINMELAVGKNPLRYVPRYIDSSVVFFDMRGFTTLSENLNLNKVHQIINLYTAIIIEYVQNNGGFVDKIIGDAVMARFNDAQSCLNAVMGIRKGLSELNRHRWSAGDTPIQFGTGISHGRVLSANFGSPAKLDRTIIGKIVNLSSRIESLTKVFKVDVLFDQTFYNQLENPEDIRFIGYSSVQGMSDKVPLYEYYGHNVDTVVKLKTKHAGLLKEYWELINGQKLMEAYEIMEKMIAECPKHNYKKDTLMDQTISELFKMHRDTIYTVQSAS